MRHAPTRKALRHLAVALVLTLAGGIAAQAGDDDHERARKARESGEALPLTEVLKAVEGQLGGEVAGIELDRDDGRYVYEFKVITPGGRLREIHVDALTARILKREDED